MGAEKFVDNRIEIGYRIVNSNTERFIEHTHEYGEVFVMLTGRAYHTANGKRRELHAGDAVFIRPRDIHKYSKIDNEEFTFCNLTFTNNTLNSLFLYLSDGFPSSALMNADMPPTATMTKGEHKNFVHKLEAVGVIPTDEFLKRKSALRILLMELFTALFSDFTPRDENTPLWLELLCSRMRAESAFKEGNKRMIELSGRTREHLSRSLKKYTGQTVSEFVSDLRLNYIANMLKNSNKKIAEIIFDSGFNSINHATTLFRKKYGKSMREFRSSSDLPD